MKLVQRLEFFHLIQIQSLQFLVWSSLCLRPGSISSLRVSLLRYNTSSTSRRTLIAFGTEITWNPHSQQMRKFAHEWKCIDAIFSDDKHCCHSHTNVVVVPRLHITYNAFVSLNRCTIFKSQIVHISDAIKSFSWRFYLAKIGSPFKWLK